jgi:hypothetical protein
MKSDRLKKSLQPFIQNQIDEKSREKNLAIKSQNQASDKSLDEENEEIKSAKENLHQAKQNSIYQSSKYDKTEMFKILFVQNFMKLTFSTLFLVVFAVAIIEGTPIIIKSLQQLVSKFFISSLSL